MSDVRIVVPLTPPGVNHYVKHTRSGRHYVTGEATAFKKTLALCAIGKVAVGKQFAVEATVYMAAKQKGDVDGFGKLILDGLADAGVFYKVNRKMPYDTGNHLSDAHVTDLTLRKRRDADNPRTEIIVRALP